jgi:hypothetical protein
MKEPSSQPAELTAEQQQVLQRAANARRQEESDAATAAADALDAAKTAMYAQFEGVADAAVIDCMLEDQNGDVCEVTAMLKRMKRSAAKVCVACPAASCCGAMLSVVGGQRKEAGMQRILQCSKQQIALPGSALLCQKGPANDAIACVGRQEGSERRGYHACCHR